MDESIVIQPKRSGWKTFLVILGVFSFLYIFPSIVISIVDSAIYWSKNSDIKPLMDSTLGVIVASDNQIFRYSTELAINPYMTKEHADYLKTRIFVSFVTIFAMLFLFTWIMGKIFGNDNGKPVLWFVIAGILLGGAEILYTEFVHDTPQFYKGVMIFVKYFWTYPTFMANVGNQSLSSVFYNVSLFG